MNKGQGHWNLHGCFAAAALKDKLSDYVYANIKLVYLKRIRTKTFTSISWGKRTAQKDTIIDITSDSQVNSNFPYRWSPAILTFNNCFYLFFYFIYNENSYKYNAPHLKSPKNQNRRAALGRPAMKLLGA